MKCSPLLAVLATLVTLVGCAAGNGSPTPNIEATVESAVAAAAQIAIPTPTPLPAQTPIGIPTPTTIPVPTSTLTPSLVDVLLENKGAVVLIKTGFGEGSGFLFDKDGWILTNSHVVGDAETVELVLGGRLTVTGRVVGRDEELDIAVIKVDFDGDLPFITFGNSNRLEQGENVATIGYPLGSQLGQSPSVTKGIVSALRILDNFEFIQTDSPVNPGNSGGPLINDRGQVVGIITEKVEKSGGRVIEGIGLAIPINAVKDVLPFLKAGASDTPVVQATSIPTPAAAPTATLVPVTPPPKGAYFDTEGNIVTPPWIPTSTPAPIPRPTPTPSPVGPLAGSLLHDPNSKTIKEFSAGVNVADFVAEAEFFNPYSSTGNSWDYGFMFRRSNSNEFDIVAVTSSRRWEHNFRSAGIDAPYEPLSAGNLSTFGVGAFDTTTRGSNRLKLVVVGENGWLFLNGQYQGTLNLDSSTVGGDVSAITGSFQGNEVEGAVTRFEDFSVTPLLRRYGPTGGNLVEQDGFISYHVAGLFSTTNAVVEARFFNPPMQDNWSYGFFLHKQGPDTFDAVFVRMGEFQSGFKSRKWHHYTRTGSGDSSVELDSSGLDSLNTGLRDSNHLLVIVLGRDGWFFVNDTFVSKLNLGDSAPGDIQALAGYFTDDEAPGAVTRFEEFTVWSP